MSKVVVTEKLISQKAASKIVEAAVEHAEKQGWHIVVAVVDRNGRLRAFAQMDHALNVAEDGAIRKARTALLGLPSGVMGKAMEGDATALASFAQLPDMAFLGGGIPISVEGDLVGAIGVGGAVTTEQDEACANAGLAILT